MKKKKEEEISVNVVNIACAHELIQPHVDYHANAVFTIFAIDFLLVVLFCIIFAAKKYHPKVLGTSNNVTA